MFNVHDLSKINRNELTNNIHELIKTNLTTTKISSFSHQLEEIKNSYFPQSSGFLPRYFVSDRFIQRCLFFFNPKHSFLGTEAN